MIKDNNLKLKEKFLEYYRELPIQKLAGESIGRHEDTIGDWKKADPDFSDQIDTARAEWAMKHSKGVKSEEWLLERVIKSHFAPKQSIDLESGGEPIQGFVILKPKDDSPDGTNQETS